MLVFAPGLGLRATDYATIAEDLASHGYVVAGMNPLALYDHLVALTAAPVVALHRAVVLA
jgi:predicted dienelactone hydrolase